MRKAAENDANLKRTLDLFTKDMEGITKVALDFFSKYANGGSGMEFAKDFERLFASLSQRIRKEKNIIHEKFNDLKIISGKLKHS